jgi:hypothetical protein
MRESKAETKTKNTGSLAAENDEFLASFATALEKHCPNDERVGCPPPEFLKTMAFGRPRMEALEPWFNHLVLCGACLRDFKRWRHQAIWRRRARVGLATAAAVILCISLVVWKVVHSPRPAVGGSGDALVSAVLDLEDRGSSRDPNGGTESASSMHQLPCARLGLSIYLPYGSEGGRYEAQLLRHHGDASPLATFSGTARIDDTRTTLSVVADFSKLPPGTYTFAYRREGGAWQYLPVAFDMTQSTPK